MVLANSDKGLKFIYNGFLVGKCDLVDADWGNGALALSIGDITKEARVFITQHTVQCTTNREYLNATILGENFALQGAFIIDGSIRNDRLLLQARPREGRDYEIHENKYKFAVVELPKDINQ